MAAPTQTGEDAKRNGNTIDELTRINKQIQTNKNDEIAYNQAIKDTQAVMSVLGPEIDSVFASLQNGQSIGETLGKVFEDLAAQIAKAAIKAAIFQSILSIFSGGTSDVLGAAGSGSSGGGFFGSFKKLLGFASGGIASGPSSGYPVMLHGTEAILNGGQLANLVKNVSASAQINAAGMSNGIQFPEYIGKQQFTGQTLKLWLQKANFSATITQ